MIWFALGFIFGIGSVIGFAMFLSIREHRRKMKWVKEIRKNESGRKNKKEAKKYKAPSVMEKRGEGQETRAGKF